jgi:hypothetical protein
LISQAYLLQITIFLAPKAFNVLLLFLMGFAFQNILGRIPAKFLRISATKNPGEVHQRDGSGEMRIAESSGLGRGQLQVQAEHQAPG